MRLGHPRFGLWSGAGLSAGGAVPCVQTLQTGRGTSISKGHFAVPPIARRPSTPLRGWATPEPRSTAHTRSLPFGPRVCFRQRCARAHGPLHLRASLGCPSALQGRRPHRPEIRIWGGKSQFLPQVLHESLTPPDKHLPGALKDREQSVKINALFLPALLGVISEWSGGGGSL